MWYSHTIEYCTAYTNENEEATDTQHNMNESDNFKWKITKIIQNNSIHVKIKIGKTNPYFLGMHIQWLN